jgi:hypothetical protein
MALANALVGPALAAMAAPAPEVPFEEQLAQVAAEAEFKRLHSFEHSEALAKELAEAWAEHKDKAMEHAKKGLVDDGGDYTFEIVSKLGATEQDVYKHLPEDLLKMKERNKMWAMRRNADSCNYIFRINYTQEAKKILERLEKEQERLAKKHLEHAAKKQRGSDTEATAVAHNKAADAYYEAKSMYNENQNITNATAVIETYEKLNNTRFDKLAAVVANYTEDPTTENALAVNAAYDEALITANAVSLPKAMQLRTDGNGLDGFIIPKNLVGREVLFHPHAYSCNPTWAKVTAQDGYDDSLVLTTHLGNKTIKRAQVIDVRRTAEDSHKMLEEYEREEAALPAAPPALCRQPSVVM